MAILQDNAPALLAGVLFAVLVVTPLIIIGNIIRRLLSDSRLPKHIPWAGVSPEGGILALARANLSSFFRMKELMDEGYSKYSKQGRPYVLPHMLTGPEVVLPLSQVPWLLAQPNNVLSQTEVNRRFLEADHTFLHKRRLVGPADRSEVVWQELHDLFHPDIIAREMSLKLSSFADDIVDELHASLSENWGTDTETWREVRVYDTLLDVIARLSTRVFVGRDLCRNRDFLRAAQTFNKSVVVSASALNLLPGFLKPFLAPIITCYDYLQYRTCARLAMPTINERLQQLKPSGETLSSFDRKLSKNDYIQWAIDHAVRHRSSAELRGELIAKRLASLCFAAIQSSVISLTNTLFDVAASPVCAESLAAMRDEVQREVAAAASSSRTRQIQGPSSSPWGKATVARFVLVDSALRESMRVNGFVARGIMKSVVAPGGVTLPDGTHLPPGVKVGVQGYSIHRDEDVYPDADKYEPFRFIGSAAAARADDGDEKATSSGSDGASSVASSSGSESESEAGDAVDGQQKTRRRRPGDAGERPSPKPRAALVTTSPTFLAFSHGAQACPGRFFAANQLKLTLAHIALLYDIEPIPVRPANKWFVGSMAPPMWETLRVRRRKPEPVPPLS